MSYPFYQNPNYPQTMYQPQVVPQYVQPTQPVQPVQQNHNPDERIWVQGESGANAYLVAPNSFVRLWDSQQPIFYEKRADASGRPITEVFTYSKKSEQKPLTEVPDNPDYTDRLNDLDRRVSRLERLISKEDNRNVQSKQSNAKSLTNDSKI